MSKQILVPCCMSVETTCFKTRKIALETVIVCRLSLLARVVGMCKSYILGTALEALPHLLLVNRNHLWDPVPQPSEAVWVPPCALRTPPLPGGRQNHVKTYWYNQHKHKARNLWYISHPRFKSWYEEEIVWLACGEENIYLFDTRNAMLFDMHIIHHVNICV